MWMKSITFVILLAIFSTETGQTGVWKSRKKPSAAPQVKIDPTIKGKLNYEVSIRLANGGIIHGVILNGELYEKLKKRDFVPIKDYKERGAGVRAWYVNDQKGYVFISYLDILEISRVKVLSEKELKRLLERLAKKEEEARLARKKAAEELEKKKIAEKQNQEELAKKEAEKKEKKEAGNIKEIIDKRLALFNKFHPNDGWNPDKQKVLKWKGPVIGVYPNKEEQEFLDNYDEWVVIYRKWKEDQDKEKEKQKEAEKKKEKGEEKVETEETKDSEDKKKEEEQSKNEEEPEGG